MSRSACSILGSNGLTYINTFEGPKTLLAFTCQDDLIGVANFVNGCLHKMDPSEGQASNQPGVAGRDAM